MASQQLSAQAEESVSLQLKKFSHVTAASLQTKFLWTHLSHSDLKATFETIRVTDSHGLLSRKRLLIIHRGQEALEQIHLDDLVYQARLDEERLQSQAIPDSSRIVFIIVKKPFLAIRYQLANAQIRRVQLNFLPESGYDTAVKILTDHGLPIRDKNDGQPQEAIGELGHPCTTTTGPKNPEPGLTHSISQTGSLGVSSGCSFMPDSVNSNINQSGISNVVFKSGPIPADLPSQSRMQFQPSATAIQAPGSFQTTVQNSSFGSYHPYGIWPMRQLNYGNTNVDDPVRRTLFADTSRPYSAPGGFDSERDMLPPPRNLPFGKGKKVDLGSQTGNTHTPRVNVWQEIAVDGLEESPIPKGKRQPTKTRRPLKKVSENEKTAESGVPNLEPSDTPEPKKARTLRPATAPSSSNVQNVPLPSIPPKAPRKPAKRKMPASYISTAMQTASTPPRGVTATQAQLAAPSKQAMSVAEEWQTAIEAFVAKYKNVAPSGQAAATNQQTSPARARSAANEPVADLNAYASRPAAERRAAIDGMIAELIMDPGFETLCEDVEGAWKRIGLGM